MLQFIGGLTVGTGVLVVLYVYAVLLGIDFPDTRAGTVIFCTAGLTAWVVSSFVNVERWWPL